MRLFPDSDAGPLRAVAAFGGVLLATLLLESAAIAVGTYAVADGYVVGALSSLPFLVALVYGSRLIAASNISETRYERIAKWCLAGALAFLAINLALMFAMPPETLFVAASWVRWAVAIGAGIGLLIGFFEARAIDREVAAERIRIRQEELKRERDKLDDFAKIVSHDLRNPLNVANGHLELARRLDDNEHLAKIQSALDRMELIIEETLTLAREGRAVGETVPVDLATAATECWSAVETPDAELRLAGSATIRADPDRLRHVFENLFRNAVEHGSTSPRSQAHEDAGRASSSEPSVADAPEDAVKHGSTRPRSQTRGDAVEHGSTSPPSHTRENAADPDRPEVTVRVGPLADSDGFYVEDDGEGIPESGRESVFETGYTSSDSGSGFGLAIVRQIVEAHGWRVRVAEGADGGARFEITGATILDT